jgi:uncharacterized protein (TIGR02246 family)
MSADEQAIRDAIAKWMQCTVSADVDGLLPLMAEDAVFLVSGHPPMRGREAFAGQFRAAMERVRFQPVSDVQEIQVQGDMAYSWNLLTITIMSRSGEYVGQRSGYVLSVWRKQDGNWVIVRDANMVA